MHSRMTGTGWSSATIPPASGCGMNGTTAGGTTVGGTTTGTTGATAGGATGQTTGGAAAGGTVAGGTTAGGVAGGTTTGGTTGGTVGGGGGGGGFRGPQAPLNCLGTDVCTASEEGEFVRDVLESGDFSGLPADQQELFEFIAFLLKNDGFKIEDFSKTLSREFAVRVIATLLKIHGKISDADITRQTRSPYPDVDITSMYGKLIALLTQLAVVEGYPDGKFRPYDEPTAAEVDRMTVGAAGYLSQLVGQYLREESFNARLSPDWFEKYLAVLRRLNIPVFQNYWQLAEPVSPLFFLTLLQKVLSAGGIAEPLSNAAALSHSVALPLN